MANTLKFGNGQWATGNGTALAYNDENANFKPLPFDFTRASSGTTVNQSGLIETVGSGLPRIDFQGNTKGALLLEPARTNLIAVSTDFSQASLSNGTVTTNNAISPDGTLDADTFICNTVSATGQFVTSGTTGLSYTSSIYVKRKTGNSQVSLRGINNISTPIDVTNQWKRFTITQTSDNGTLRCGVLLSAIGDEVYVWGAQTEEGSYATSYIPTSGSAVTRVGEKCENNLSNVVSLTEGVIYIDTTNLGNDGTNSNIISQSSVVDTVYCLKVGSNNKILMGLFASSVNIPITSTSAFPLGTRTKIAFHYKSGNSKLYINGSLEGTNAASFTLGSGFATALRLIDTSLAYNAFPSKSIAREFKVYNTGLTDAELIALTQV